MSWLLYNQCIPHTTCETVNKSGIVIICYLDSESTGYILNIKKLLLKCSFHMASRGVCRQRRLRACFLLFNHDKYIKQAMCAIKASSACFFF